MKGNSKGNDKLLNLSDVRKHLRTRIIILSPEPPASELSKLAKKPPIPPVPGPCGNKINCLSNIIDIDKIINPNPIRVQKKHFKPYLEMLHNERFSVSVFTTKRQIIESVEIDTSTYKKYKLPKFKQIPIDIKKLDIGTPYVMIISDDYANMLHIAFQLT